MLKKSYLVLGSIIFCLLFSFPVFAGTETTVSRSANVTNGSQITFQTKSYSGLQAEEITSDGTDNYALFSPILNVLLNGVNQKYLNGHIWVDFDINFLSSGSVASSFTGAEYVRPTQDDGIKTFISPVSHSWFRLYVIFDNYYSNEPNIDLGYIKLNFQSRYGDVTPLTGSLSVSMTTYSNTVTKTDFQNNRTTEEIYNAIYQATGQQLTDMLNMLTAINQQDYIYYNQLVTQLASLNQAQNTTNSNLLLILNELDLDFQQVQTILDLFPSYRTQVLQYWQELLQMNAAQSSAAAEMDNEYTNKESQSGQLVNGLGSLNLPSVDANDFNILGNVDNSSKTNFFGLIGLITNNSLITTILIIIVTGAIVGYALYGKK